MKLEPKLAQWRDGYPAKVDAAVALVEFMKIREKNRGEITPKNVVDAARVKRNPLHKAFVWDNDAAAEMFREEQARSMLRAIYVQREEGPKYPTRVLETKRLPMAPGDERPRKVYMTVEDILKDPDSRADLLKRALGELLSFQKRFRGLQELALVFRAVDKVLTTVSVDE